MSSLDLDGRSPHSSSEEIAPCGDSGETGFEPLASPSGVSQQELTTVEDAELCWLDLPEPELLAAVPRAPPPCDDIERGTAD
jgi:hypothetical protein